MSVPRFPKELRGVIFTEIIPQLLPEVNPEKLVELGAIIRKKGKVRVYQPLTESLRKIQWVKLVALKAIDIEDEIGSKMEPDTLVTDPVGQTAHALCVTDCLIHTKSALDSIGVFLTDLMDLDAKDGNRDLKKRRFRKMLADKDPVLGHQIEKMRPWFKELQDIRDEWIHRSALRCKLIHGPSEVGLLPIPRNVMLDLEEQDKLPLTRKNFWSTGDFVQHHYSNLVTLFNTIIEGCIQIERKEVMEPISIPSGIEKELWVFPIRLTKEMKPRKMTVKFPKTLRDW